MNKIERLNRMSEWYFKHHGGLHPIPIKVTALEIRNGDWGRNLEATVRNINGLLECLSIKDEALSALNYCLPDPGLFAEGITEEDVLEFVKESNEQD